MGSQRSGVWRWLLIAVLLLVLLASTQFSLMLQGFRGARDLPRLLPDNAGALARSAADAAAEATSGSGKEQAARAIAVRDASAALRREPGNVSAAATLGLVTSLEGDQARARKFFQYSALRSRRDLRTQLWLIEDSVAQGSVSQALRYYDIALRASTQAPKILFPVLAPAVSDPEIRKGLLSILRQEPAWRPGFEAYLAEETKDYGSAIALFDSLRRAASPPAEHSDNVLMSKMVTAGDVDAAWTYYRSLRPDIDPLQPRNASFRPNGTDGSPFDWSLINENGISASLGSDPNGGLLMFSVSPSIGGVIAQQVQRLAQGSYRLVGRSRSVNAPGYAIWKVLCSDGRTLGAVPLRDSDGKANGFAVAFTVPAANCGVQLLRLEAQPNDEIQGSSGEVLDVRFEKVTQS